MFIFQLREIKAAQAEAPGSFKVYGLDGGVNATPRFSLTPLPNISNAEYALKILFGGVTALIPPTAIIAQGSKPKVVDILVQALDARVQICDQFKCFPPGEFQASLMGGLSDVASMTLFEKMRPLFASSEKRVQYLTNEITFLFNHDFRGKMEYSTHDDAVATVCQNFKIDENALADLNKILSSDGNYQKLKAVSLQDGKEYVIMKGYRSGTLAVYESNKKIPSSEYIEERLNAINDSTCFITAKYAAKFAESKGKAVSEISFNKGVAEISLGTEQLTLDMGGIIYETMNAVVENKYVTWKRADPQNEPATKDGHAQQTEQPAKPIVLTDASLGAIKAIISNRAITMNIKKEYDANLGKGSFDNFANQAVSRLYGIYLKLSQSAQSDGGGGNAFMNAVADLQVRSSIRDMQETSAFTYDIAKKKKEEKDDQDGKTGSGFA